MIAMFEAPERFVTECRSAFRDLVSRFGFSESEPEVKGRECFVKYHKGHRTISISWEPGLTPIVEPFAPAELGDDVTPWAARGETAYSRRILQLHPVDPGGTEQRASGVKYLERLMERLEALEAPFLLLSAAPDATSVAADLDAVHERAREAYMRRDVSGYNDTLHPELEYTQIDGRTIGRDELAHDVRVQLARMHSADTEFRRETLEVDGGSGIATETLEQRATFQARAFGIVCREWTIRRRGRYEWLRTADGWKLRRVQVLGEEVLPARTWIAIR